MVSLKPVNAGISSVGWQPMTPTIARIIIAYSRNELR